MLYQTFLLESIHSGLTEALGETGELRWLRNLSGGDINQAALISDGKTNWFLKFHEHAPEGMFKAEARALKEISALNCIRAPSPIATGRVTALDGQVDWLVLEYLDLIPNGPESQLGEQLAALHGHKFTQYGWSRNNYIGSTPQDNTVVESWALFWRDRRLLPQLELAKNNGFGEQLSNSGEQLLDSIEQIMDDHQPVASLLHGDLWAGNKAFTRDGLAVIFDPASYHGDRETDIAMSELFGGFGADFYAAYEAVSPLADGYQLRRDLYNLYHVLNHLNLFGQAYLGRSQNMISSLLAQIR
jgi:protein-ribulosamine 3-kinase